jgi:hypothetical protein
VSTFSGENHGAYEDIDDVISFLKSFGFIEFSSKKNISLQTVEKQYYITITAMKKMEDNLANFESLHWYVKRCNLVKKYFGDLTGTQLKMAQYKIDEYRETSYNEFIGSIEGLVIDKYYDLYEAQL